MHPSWALWQLALEDVPSTHLRESDSLEFEWARAQSRKGEGGSA